MGMNGSDQSMEQRVWQRVTEQTPAVVQDAKPLLLAAREQAAVYDRLAKQMSGRNRSVLRKLQEKEGENIACLKGICALQGIPVKGNAMVTPREPARKALEKCFHRTRRAQTEYMARSIGGEFGEVYRALADRSREQCVLLAELMGRL